mmetsp:Transcript_2467/g.7563  ORF Transcript_2467/g.7563 Transcript_2467/m.7563 type:complete len:221 (-) Transcript_2467:596-1258(-)
MQPVEEELDARDVDRGAVWQAARRRRRCAIGGADERGEHGPQRGEKSGQRGEAGHASRRAGGRHCSACDRRLPLAQLLFELEAEEATTRRHLDACRHRFVRCGPRSLHGNLHGRLHGRLHRCLRLGCRLSFLCAVAAPGRSHRPERDLSGEHRLPRHGADEEGVACLGHVAHSWLESAGGAGEESRSPCRGCRLRLPRRVAIRLGTLRGGEEDHRVVRLA